MSFTAFIPWWRQNAGEPGPDRPDESSASGKAATGIPCWHRVALRYDVRRMSKGGLSELAHDLFVGGAISLPDHRLLSLDPVTYAPHWPDWAAYETLGEAGGRRDWIEEVEARIRKGHPEQAYIDYQESLLSLLRRVEAARQEATQSAQPVASTERPERAHAWPVRAGLTSRIPRPASI